MVVAFHGQASGALSGCCAEPRLRPCRRWRTTPQLRLFPRPARPPSPRHPRGRGRRSVVRAARPSRSGVSSWHRLGSGAVRLGRATRWRRMRDVRATRWRRVVRYFLATAHMLTLVPLGGAECAMCVPLGGVEWCARDTARLRGHQRGRRHRRAAQGGQGQLAYP